MTGISGNRTMTLTWDARNRISQMQVNTIPAYSYQYDPSGYRIQKNAGGTNNNYYLQGENLEAIYGNTGIVQAQYFRGSVIDEIVNGYQQDSTGKLINYTYHHDALESLLGQSGHDGSILATQSYSAFGGILSQTGSSNNAQKYTGREIDSETGFYYYRARYYDPIIGRFISEDPKGFGGGSINLYAYCLNNPVNCNDPTGEIPLPIVTGGIGFVAGAVGNTAGQVIGQLINNGKITDFSLKNVGIAAGVGFAAGVAAPYTATTLLGAAVTGGVANITQYGITQAVNAQSVTANDALLNGATGLLGGTFGGAIGKSGGLRFSEYSSFIDSGFARQLNNNLDVQVNTLASTLSRTFAGATVSNFDLSVFNFNSQSSASGGFLLYPNKANTNMMQSVYSK
jgi:RHS repeat-associated protein